MKILLRLQGCLFFCCLPLLAQNSQASPCTHPNASQFDFWLGQWDLSWPGGQMGVPEDSVGHATNSISRTLGGCVIAESFEWESGHFRGQSYSVLDPKTGIWRQTWVDNQGGYLLFSGEFKDGQMILKTQSFERNGKTYVSRMVFRNLKENSFDWDWQRSEDLGKTWKDLWNIHYQRHGS